jgi:hypothetical protein
MEEPLEILQPQPDSQNGPSMPLPARLTNVFALPGDVFDAVRAMPFSLANWLVPALILVAICWASVWLLFSQDSIRHQVDELATSSIQKQADAHRITEQQADQMRGTVQMVTQAGKVAGPVLAAFITPFWWGLVLWLVGTKRIKADFSYLKAVEVAGLASMISVLDVAVKTLLILGMNDIFASPSLALLLKQFDPQNSLHSLLAILNLMTFWRLAVLSIGLARLSRVSLAKAAAWVCGLWTGWTSLMLGIGALGQALTRLAQ